MDDENWKYKQPLHDAVLTKSQNTKLSYYIKLLLSYSDNRPYKPIQAHPNLYTYEYTFFNA